MAVVKSKRFANRLLLSTAPALLAGLGLILAPATSRGAVAYDCSSKNPALWPPATKPYFMLLVDTSGSMLSCTNPYRTSTTTYVFPGRSCPSTAPRNSCGLEPTRLNDAKCALKQTVQAFGGQVNFGLSTYAVRLANCSNGAVPDTCTNANGSCDPGNVLGTEGEYYSANGCTVSAFTNPNGTVTCGNSPDCAATAPAAPNLPENFRNGGNIVVPMLQDATWAATQPASNVDELLKWFDGRTDESKELFALGYTPLEGILRTAQQYMAAGWNPNWADGNYCASGLTYTYPTPLNSLDRPCRNVNFILVTDGDETCGGTATNVASALYNTGVTIGGNNFKIKTHVINFAGGGSDTDAIAAAGGTVSSLVANNEAELSLQLSNIISSSIKPEVCNNADDNCNGCVDEGYGHYCNRRPTCCAWSNTTQRDTCLTNYTNTITASDPDGDLNLLPCTTQTQSTQSSNWLCYDPKEVCDDQDTNCDGTTDEGVTKCGSPLACPKAETCNGQDDDCDNIVDNAPGNGIPYSLPGCSKCVPSAEICDGCDNDCDGVVDDGIAPSSCGFSPPANCAGTRTCTAAPGTVTAGACLSGGYPKNRWNACTNTPGTEVCDSIDNDCDGAVDDGITPTACDVPNKPNLYYKDSAPRQFALSQCVRGQKPCNGTCSGYVGPSTEICDGIDNDCNGVVDDNVPGVGNICGTATGQCSKGLTACVGGVLVCTGGTTAQPEVCNGLDDDCDGTTDDAPLTDAPADSSCWTIPAGSCTTTCKHQNAQWCPPAGATCTTTGTLTAPCKTGTLVCNGVSRWTCQGGVTPGSEVCDGADNNCNGQVDDSLGAPIGTPCAGNTVGECDPGKQVCVGGKIECQGAVGPGTEICDGKDNNCNNQIDEGLVGGQCWPTDPRFPGDRTKGECRPGVSACNAGADAGGGTCTGGVGPQPEVCDGKDNDCDGLIDESGAAPDGVDGSTDPLNPSHVLGAECGTDVGECQKGGYVCKNATVICLGGVSPSTEICDCADNDCDGVVDNDASNGDAGGTPICARGTTCVQATANNCQCAGPCLSGEFPCLGGTSCENVSLSGKPDQKLNVCVSDNCGDCSTKTAFDSENNIACAPTGSVPSCVCKNNECRSPCEGRDCGGSGIACVPRGPAAGQCQPETNCNFFGCESGFVCNLGACVKDPCSPNPCAAGEVCKPNTSFTAARCVNSCATTTCGAAQKCVEGTCEPTGCGTACATGQYCQPAGADAGVSGSADAAADAGADASLTSDAGVYVCGPSKCPAIPCSDGSYCNPVTGTCGGNQPCAGVVCPGGQQCVAGECYWTPEGGVDGGGTGGTAGSGGTSGSGGTAGTGNDAAAGSSNAGAAGTQGGGSKSDGQWGLATGGGGCACRTAPNHQGTKQAVALAALALGAFFVRRKRTKTTRRTQSEVSR